MIIKKVLSLFDICRFENRGGGAGGACWEIIIFKPTSTISDTGTMMRHPVNCAPR